MLARKIAGGNAGHQGQVVGVLGPEPEKERVTDDLDARLMNFWDRKLQCRAIRVFEQDVSDCHVPTDTLATFNVESFALS